MKSANLFYLLMISFFVLGSFKFECLGEELQQDYYGARFNEGKGIEVSEETKNILALQTVEVEEMQEGTQTVSIVPASSILKTVTGTYVYVVNGNHYLRTQVAVSKIDEQIAHITDGLFLGDEVVSKPVNSLWYAELQALRGGKACTEGH